MNLRPEVEIEKSWHKILKDYFETESFKDLTAFVQAEYLGKRFTQNQKIFLKL